jgi:di/tricarboxylate transporter
MSYIIPVGYQTNLLVMSAGGYTFSDFARVGLPLQIIMWFGLSTALALLYDL